MSKIIAHRGASYDYPENTMLAFEKAVEQGADGIETDVHFTKDKKLVICHDERIDRTADGKGLIGEMTFEELLAFDFGVKKDAKFAGQKMPALSELLALIKKTGLLLNIEVKNEEGRYEGIVPALVDLVKEYGVEDRVIYSSFDHTTLVELKAYDPSVKTGALYSNTPYDAFHYMKKIGVDAIHPKYTAVFTQDMCSKMLADDKMVNVWTVDDPALARRLTAAGVTSLITNRPAFLREQLAHK